MRITVDSGLHMTLEVEETGAVRLARLSPRAGEEETAGGYAPLAELHATGFDADGHNGSRHSRLRPGLDLRYSSHELLEAEGGRSLLVYLQTESLRVAVQYRFFDGIPVIRGEVMLENAGHEPLTVDYLTSLCVSLGQDRAGESDSLHIPVNNWCREMQWQSGSLQHWGLGSIGRIWRSQTGTWSSSEVLPMGLWETAAGECVFWQIEHNGSWYWEMAKDPDARGTVLQLTGPNEENHQCCVTLRPGERFTTVPAALGIADAGANSWDAAFGALTAYRRVIRRPHADNRQLPVVFNDYMNCLCGDPDEKKLPPLIDAAADAGCEVFVIDAGWYDDDPNWWPGIGAWKESKRRFPHGLSRLTDRIRERGMIPGLWVEIEEVGASCPLANTLLDDWFFQRHGRRVLCHGRYQLDFRNPAVRRYATETLERLIREYGVGYFKNDYNVNFGTGTDRKTDTPGAGLLEHNRAFLAWMDEFLAAHPEVVLENCASGGMRMDYAMLSRLTIQSTSDQTDYRLTASISAMSPTAVTPEQAAVWSYPHYEGDEEQAVFNMVSVLLRRIHQSGYLNRMSLPVLARVREGIAFYKTIRADIPFALPVFPLGPIPLEASWSCAGLRWPNRLLLAVWRTTGKEDTLQVPLPYLAGRTVKLSCPYPSAMPGNYAFRDGVLMVSLPTAPSARLLLLEW